jgi:exopolysaccharide biosynthesis polyprenyl glycosylphosphotransferase
VLILLDFLGINGGFIFSLYFRPDYSLSWQLIIDHPEWFILLNALWFILGSLFQVYDLNRAGTLESAFQSVAAAGMVTMLTYNFIPYIPPYLPPSRAPLFVTLLVPLVLILLGRSVYLLVFSGPAFRRRVLILGAGWAGQTVFQALQQHGRAVYQVVGFIDDDPLKQDKRITSAGNSESRGDDSRETKQLPPVLGPSSELLEIVDQEEISTLVLAITSDVSGELYQVLTRCLQREMEILPMPVLYEQLTGKVPVQHIGDHWSVAMPLEHPGTKLVWHAVKRLFDLFWAGLGLVFLALLFPFLALAIYIDSPGPIFYRQQRMGRNEEVFWVYKFRSMIPDAEQGEAVWAEKEDPRVTRVGKLMRKTHLDEFPQFLNILRGEMSVVGPRPERPEFIEELAEEIPFYRVRLAVKPGMAGWGLIHQGYGASVEDALEKLQYDLYYIKHQSLGLDMYILFRTFWDTISLGGR